MSRSTIPMALVAAVLVAMVPAAAGATTTCSASMPSTAGFPHTPTQSGVPQVSAVNVSVDAACNLTITDTITNRAAGLQPGDALTWYLNTDQTTTTGDPNLGGADVAVFLQGSTGAATLVPWNPDAGRLDTTLTTTVMRTNFGFTAGLAALSAVPGNVGMIAAASSTGSTDTDFIPSATASGPASLSFAVQFSTTPVSAPPTSKTCVAPKVVGKTLAAAKRALAKSHCAIGTVSRPKAVRRGVTLVVRRQHKVGQRVNLALGKKG